MDDHQKESDLTVTHPACLVDGSDAEFRKLINGLLPFAARLLSVRDGFGSLLGLTGIRYSLLSSIAHLSRENAVTVNRLAEHLHVSGAFVTIETNKLKKLGLIYKLADPDDKRKVRISVTPLGKRMLRELTGTQQSINNVLFDNVTKSEFTTLCSLVDRLVRNGDRATLDLSHLIARQEKV
jgi:DNA-binding MarR family transcriptional regulator